jgi:UDP-N-acetylglucosamine 2-epimerase (non-hydrolysing)
MPIVLEVVGARPNFVKMAALDRAFANAGLRRHLVHTGQHYDEQMSTVFFDQLELPRPDTYLGTGGGTHAQQTARIMEAFEPVVERVRPDLVVVVGDVDSTLACTLVAAKLHVPVAHVEAGLRSGDRSMPEEINRLAVDHVADYLFASEPDGVANLRREGLESRTEFVGNVMIDSLLRFREAAAATDVHARLGIHPDDYALATLHRPANVDTPDALREVVGLLRALAGLRPTLLPLHPRTKAALERDGLLSSLRQVDGLTLTPPMGYLDFLHLTMRAALVVTDSGGVQEETTLFGVPCLTVRDSTERPVTITHGTNELVTLDAHRVALRAAARLAEPREPRQAPPLWDGRAAERVAEHIAGLLG